MSRSEYHSRLCALASEGELKTMCDSFGRGTTRYTAHDVEVLNGAKYGHFV